MADSYQYEWWLKANVQEAWDTMIEGWSKLNSHIERLSWSHCPGKRVQQSARTDNENFVVMVCKRLETNFIKS